MNAPAHIASSGAQPKPAAHPAKAPGPSTERETVVPLRTDLELGRALAPWANWGRHQTLVKARLIATDLSILWVCFMAGRVTLLMQENMSLLSAANLWWAKEGPLRLGLFALVAIGMVGWMGSVQGHYTASRRKPWWDEARQMVTVVICAALADAMLIYLGKWPISRIWTGVTWLFVIAALPLARYSIRSRLHKAGRLAQPYVLIGRPKDLEQAATALASERFLGYTPVAVVCPDPGERVTELGPYALAPIALTPAVRKMLMQPGAYQIVTVMSDGDNAWLHDLNRELMMNRDDIIVIPAISRLPLYGMEVSHFFSHDVVMLRSRNNLKRGGPQLLKRLLDIVGSASLLALLSPLFVYFAWRVSRDGGKPFFGHTRVGQNGKPFDCYKFRSMVVNAKEDCTTCSPTTPKPEPNGRAISNSKMTRASAKSAVFCAKPVSMNCPSCGTF